MPFWNYPQLERLLERQREHTESVQQIKAQITPWVFHRDGKQMKDFRGAWEKARKDAGLPGRRVHDLRRSCVRRLEKSGVSRSAAMTLTSHLTESVYRRYAIVAESDLAEATGKLATYQEGQLWAKHGQSKSAEAYVQ